MPGADAAGEDAGAVRPPAGTTRLRVRFAKLGRVRFTSHRDVVRMWERALRRSGLAVAWSEGFSPRPLISFGLALPTGAESVAEYLDVVLHGGALDGVELGALGDRLSSLLPEGVFVQAAARAPAGSGSLQQEVSSCSWKLEVLGLAAEELASRVERFLASPSVFVERERKGRIVIDDLRPALLALSMTAAPGAGIPGFDQVDPGRAGVWLDAELATRPRGVRPRELLEGLGHGLRLARACRTHQWIERDGARWQPLVVRGRDTEADAATAAGRAP